MMPFDFENIPEQATGPQSDVVVAIIGGGPVGLMALSNLVYSYSCASASGHVLPSVQIDWIDKNGQFGPGEAYGLSDEKLLLTRPAIEMSLNPSDPLDFVDFLSQKYDKRIDQAHYATRGDYKEYLDLISTHIVDSLADSLAGITINRRHDEVLNLVPMVGRQSWAQLACGQTLVLDFTILALGQDRPQHFDFDGGRAFPFNVQRMDHILSRNNEGTDVMIVGSGAEMADAVMVLEENGYQGTYHIVSSHGTMPFDEGATEPPSVTKYYDLVHMKLDNLLHIQTPDEFNMLLACEMDAAQQNGFCEADVYRSLLDQTKNIEQSKEPSTQSILLDWQMQRIDHLRTQKIAPLYAHRLEQLFKNGRLRVTTGVVDEPNSHRQKDGSWVVSLQDQMTGQKTENMADHLVDARSAYTSLLDQAGRIRNNLLNGLYRRSHIMVDHHSGRMTSHDKVFPFMQRHPGVFALGACTDQADVPHIKAYREDAEACAEYVMKLISQDGITAYKARRHDSLPKNAIN